ncbi:MAG: glycine--tRNA ligase, partial [Nanoarchaeota archaeon]|nr:glycine--tRNA ligase [Nanoarchaeota archaeon]
FCKRKGFVFPSSLIYGGLSGFWDFGPLGVELFNNLKKEWWKFFVQEKENMIGIEASIISHPRTWKASGHIANFSDVSVKCKKCKKFSKVDKHELESARCGFCGGELDKQSAKDLNLMLKTQLGPVEEDSLTSYLRPETAQGMFMDFRLVQETSRKQLPFGIAQIGKCFRNEIAPRDFLFRSREFHIAEFEFFINPEEKKCDLLDKTRLDVKLRLLDAETQEKGSSELKETSIGKMLGENNLEEWHAYWLAEQLMWFEKIGLEDRIKVREHMKSELSHYSSATFDLDYEYPFGSKEIAGNANRGNFDLSQHIKESGEKLDLFDEKTKKRVIPRVIEPTFGVERMFLALLCKAYTYDEKRQNIVLKIPAFLAPVKAAVFPLINDEKMEILARDIFNDLKKEFNVAYDCSGSVGRRYSRNDESGTPFCITIDEKSLRGRDVTVRDRDTTQQIRVKISEIKEVLRKLINSEIEFEKAGKIVETRVK